MVSGQQINGVGSGSHCILKFSIWWENRFLRGYLGIHSGYPISPSDFNMIEHHDNPQQKYSQL